MDGGSSADVLTLEAFGKMRLDRGRVKRCVTPLVVFGGGTVNLERIIELPITFGKDPKSLVKMISFLVVDCPSFYNIILGRPTLH